MSGTSSRSGKGQILEEAMRKIEEKPAELLKLVSAAPAGTALHAQALDSVVSVNSFFTAAVFVGLAFTSPQAVAGTKAGCVGANPAEIAEVMMVMEVVAFSCYLFSSLVAQGVKLVMARSNIKTGHPSTTMPPWILRVTMLVCALGTVAGTLFLTASIAKLVEMRLGLLSCGSTLATAAILPLVSLVTVGLLSFISAAIYSILA